MKLKKEIPSHMNVKYTRYIASSLRLRYSPGVWSKAQYMRTTRKFASKSSPGVK